MTSAPSEHGCNDVYKLRTGYWERTKSMVFDLRFCGKYFTRSIQHGSATKMVPVSGRCVRQSWFLLVWVRFGCHCRVSEDDYSKARRLTRHRVVASETFAAKFVADDVQSGLVVSMFTTGAFFGAALAGPSGDWAGRRITIMIGSLIFVLGGGLQTGAQTLAYLYSGRFLAGLGVGFLTMIVPL